MSVAPEEIYELLASQATEGLSAAETEHLEALLADHPGIDPGGFEQAAAAVHLALLGPEQPLPARVKMRLVAAGERHLLAATELPAASSDRPAAFAGYLGWWAAAAALAIAAIGWWPRLQPTEGTLTETPAVVADTPERLLASAGTLQLPWTATEDATAVGATGEVIWNNELQRGFMRFEGLTANDPQLFQYQLWIFDRARDERYPVDGGVFDMTADGEVVVPIDAKIAVDEPYLFAITVEQPGGVVVSSRERIALLAQA